MRELIHVVEQAVVLCNADVIGPHDLPASVVGHVAPTASAPPVEPLTLREVERRHIFSVLERVGGNRAQAARILGTSERTCYRLLEKYRRASLGPNHGNHESHQNHES